MEKLTQGPLAARIRRHPVVAAVSALFTMLIGCQAVFGLVIDEPILSYLWVKSTQSVDLRAVWSATSIALPYAAIIIGGLGLLYVVIVARRTQERPTQSEDLLDRQALDDLTVLYNLHAKPALGAVERIVNSLKDQLSKRNPFAVLLEHPVDRLRNQRARLAQALPGTSIKAGKIALLAMYRSYLRAVHWMHAAEVDGIKLTNRKYEEAYTAWERKHNEFVAEFRRLVERSRFSDLKGSMRNAELNAENQRASMYQDSVRQTLSKLGDDERSFLYLFSLHQNPTKAEDRALWLDNLVYRAGVNLSHSQVLVQEDCGKEQHSDVGYKHYSHVRFTLSKAAERELRRMEWSDIVRTSFEIALDEIQGSGNTEPGLRPGPVTPQAPDTLEDESPQDA